MRTGPSGSVKYANLVQPSRHESDVSGERARARGSLIDRHALLQEIDHQASRRNGSRDIVRTVEFPSGAGSRGSATAEPTPVVFVVDDDVSVRESLELPEAASGIQLERGLGLLIDRLLARRERRGRTLRSVVLSAVLVEHGGTWREQAASTR